MDELRRMIDVASSHRQPGDEPDMPHVSAMMCRTRFERTTASGTTRVTYRSPLATISWDQGRGAWRVTITCRTLGVAVSAHSQTLRQVWDEIERAMACGTALVRQLD